MTSNLADIATQAIGRDHTPPPKKEASSVIRKLFVTLHGNYGSLFTAKFSTGELDSQGKDKGIRAAMLVWTSQLAKYPDDVIEAATQRLAAECRDYPPGLPKFEELCMAAMPRKSYAEESGMLALPAPMPAPPSEVQFNRRDDGRDWARRIIARAEAGDRISHHSLKMARQAFAHK